MKKFAIIFFLFAGPGHAEEPEAVEVVATYLSEPTEWCAADEGVPLITKVTVPNVVAITTERPKSVEVRRGGDDRTDKQIFNTFRVDDDAPVVGQFLAELWACQNPWGPAIGSGQWRIVGHNGIDLHAGYAEYTLSRYSFSAIERTFKDNTASYSRVSTLRFGEYTLLVTRPEKIIKTQSFATSEQQ